MVEKIVNNKVPESEWEENFCVLSSSLKELCNKLKLYLQKKSTRMRAPISVETQVASFLYYISYERQYKKTASSFGISRASVSVIIQRVFYSIVKYLSSDYMKVAKSTTKVEHSTSLFLDTGFPRCLSTIDGTHIGKAYWNYTNRKGYTSISVQAACDYSYCFMDVVVKWAGSVHDARIFQNSSLNKMVKDGTVLFQTEIQYLFCWEVQHTLFFHM